VTIRFWAALGALASLWGASYMFIKLGLEDLSPAAIVFARVLLGGLVLAPVALARGSLGALRGAIPAIFALAAIQIAAPFLLISYGEQRIDSSLAGILIASTPVMTALLAPFVDRDERSHGSALVGVLLGIVGVGLLLGVDATSSGRALVGALMVLLAALGYVVGAFMLRARFGDAEPAAIATATMLASAAMTLPWALATAPGEAPGLGSVAAVAALGVLGTGVAFAVYYRLIGEYGPARTSLVAYIAPGFAVFYGVALLDESISAATIAGLLLIVGGSWLAAGSRGAGAGEAPVRAVPAGAERRSP
jgi:drug/metabolite transporter (DMT)-like permease